MVDILSIGSGPQNINTLLNNTGSMLSTSEKLQFIFRFLQYFGYYLN